jgi:hypothetical protein
LQDKVQDFKIKESAALVLKANNLSPPRMSAMSAMSGLSGNYNNFTIN